MQNRDVVVIGASAGGLEALTEIVAALPPELPAAIFIAQHISPVGESHLPELLSRRGPLPAEYPNHGQAIQHGRIYVAPADTHLSLRFGSIEVTRGPRENGHRPSVDVLFRSAARTYGPRVIGVVLSGYLDCGTAGLLSIRARAGVGVAQDPKTAAAPDMPSSAIERGKADHVAGVAELGALLRELVAQPAPSWDAPVDDVIAALEGDRAGKSVEFSCPKCQGVLREVAIDEFHQFRCHVGHTFSLRSVLAEQTEETERALWSAVRALEESAALAGRVSSHSKGELQLRFTDRQRVLERNAEVVRRLLVGCDSNPALDTPEDMERNNGSA